MPSNQVLKKKKKRGRRQTGTQNIYFECLSPITLEIIAEHSNLEWLWLSLGTYVSLKEILIEVFDFVLPWKLRLKDT